jgi:hypothetical protein
VLVGLQGEQQRRHRVERRAAVAVRERVGSLLGIQGKQQRKYIGSYVEQQQT